MVHRHRQKGRADGLLERQGLHDHPALRLRDLGEHPARARQPLQGDRPPERLHAALHPGVPPAEGKGPREGLCAGGGLGHRGRQRKAHGAPVRAPDERDPFLRALPEDHQVLPRPAEAVQPVVLRRALGKDDAPVPALLRVPVAGGPHDARDRRGSHGGNARHAPHL